MKAIDMVLMESVWHRILIHRFATRSLGMNKALDDVDDGEKLNEKAFHRTMRENIGKMCSITPQEEWGRQNAKHVEVMYRRKNSWKM